MGRTTASEEEPLQEAADPIYGNTATFFANT
jgi:hypothetical protein